MKKTTLAERYKDIKPVGVYSVTNWGGLVILAIIGDQVISAFDWGEGIKNVRQTNIMYTPSGRDYIKRYGHIFYLDQIMKV